MDVNRSISVNGVVRCLDRVAPERGAPSDLRAGGHRLRVEHWCRFNRTNTCFHRPRIVLAERLVRAIQRGRATSS